MELWYPKGYSFGLTAFLDTDHAGCIDSRKSTSGGIQFLGDKLVSWMSKKQNCTAMSSAEAEYVALSASCAPVMWTRTQLQDYDFNYNKIPLYQSIGTPMATKPKLDVDLSGNPVDQTDYLSKNRSLMYLTSSRPDIVQAVCYCARYQSRPTEKHLKKVKRIFRYLRGTINMGLWYPKGSSFGLTAFSDVDHVGCIDTRKSTSGGIQFLSDKLVSWMSKKQNCTAMLSAEAEYVALSARCAQVIWMRTQLQDYGLNYNKILLYCDSQSAIAISCNLVQHSRTKHIHTRYHFIKEQVENEHPSDTYVFTVKMEILLEPTSYKLLKDSNYLTVLSALRRFGNKNKQAWISRWCCSLIPAESDSSPHAHAQTTKTFAKSDIQDLP
nr:retrovirus-related Pol polyprotein from transposon TNT 1-94 [Tanacetum cinerariifolium]